MDGVAATVNGEPITMSEYDNHMGLKRTAQIVGPSGLTQMPIVGTFGLQSMQELVDRKILMDWAKEEGVAPTDKEIDDELKFQIRLRPDYVSGLADQGVSHDMLLKELAVGLAREHLVMKGVTVSPSEVDAYVKSHPDDYSDPAKAVVLFIQLLSPTKESAVDAELAKGAKFSEVAKKFSEDPHAKESGGLLGFSVISSMPKPVQDIVNKAAVGKATPWSHLGRGYYKFFVDKKTATVRKKPTEDEREIVRRRIALEKGLVKNDFDNQFYKKLKASKVEISVPYLKDSWQKSWEQMSTPSGGPAAGTTPPR